MHVSPHTQQRLTQVRTPMFLFSAVVLPALILGPLLGILVMAMAQSKEAADAAAREDGGAPAVGGNTIPRPKRMDILRGFFELRKGMFWEKREKVWNRSGGIGLLRSLNNRLHLLFAISLRLLVSLWSRTQTPSSFIIAFFESTTHPDTTPFVMASCTAEPHTTCIYSHRSGPLWAAPLTQRLSCIRQSQPRQQAEARRTPD